MARRLQSPPMPKPSALVDTRVIYCGDNIEQLAKLPDKCIDLIYIDPPFNSNRNYEVFWGEKKEQRAFEDRHESTKAKFRDHVRSKTDTAMKNEVFCKFLCHNLCCVVQSQCELGIEATFWPGQ